MSRFLPAFLVAAALFAAPAVDAARARFNAFTSVEHPELGFSIAYPTGVFQPSEAKSAGLGRVFVSPDGKAKLLVGAFDNGESTSLADYRAYLLESNYAGAAIDYAPVKKHWFVLSGERNGTMFYERVSLTCGGRVINSWAMLYPAAERAFYDRVVEAVARTYTPGAGPNGNCRLPDPEADAPATQ